MFYKNSPPLTRRQNIDVAVFCVIAALTAAAIIAIDWISLNDLHRQMPKIDSVSVFVFDCSEKNFFGRRFYWSTRAGNACYDWSAGKWELAQHMPW